MIISPGQKLNRDIFLIFFNMKICCVFSLELPHRGDSNEYTLYTIFNMNKKNTLNYPKPAVMGFFSKGLKNEFETTVVNEPSVFEPLKFYCKYNILERAIKTKQYNNLCCGNYQESPQENNSAIFFNLSVRVISERKEFASKRANS